MVPTWPPDAMTQMEEPSFKLNEFLIHPSAASLCRPPLLPRMPCCPLALAGLTHSLALVLSGLRPAEGSAGQPRATVAAPQLPPQFVEPSQQTGLALHRDPLAPLPGQVPDAAQTGGAVARTHAARHLRSWKTHTNISPCSSAFWESQLAASQSPFVLLKPFVLLCRSVSVSRFLSCREGRL